MESNISPEEQELVKNFLFDYNILSYSQEIFSIFLSEDNLNYGIQTKKKCCYPLEKKYMENYSKNILFRRVLTEKTLKDCFGY